MLFIYLGIYTLFIAGIWLFFILAKIHSYKFKGFSTHIVKVTKTLLIILMILSLLGYILILSSDLDGVTSAVNTDGYNYSDIQY